MISKRSVLILLTVLLAFLWGCEPSRTYRKGLLAEHYRMMSNADLRHYQERLNDEIVKVAKGGPVPVDVNRAVYLEDLQTRWKDVESQIQGNIRRQRYEQYRKSMDLMYGY